MGTLADAVSTAFSSASDEEWLTSVEDAGNLLSVRHEAVARVPTVPPSAIRVTRVRFRDSNAADVRFVVSLSGTTEAVGITLDTSVVRRDGHWLVSRDAFCAAVQRFGVQCPPREDAS